MGRRWEAHLFEWDDYNIDHVAEHGVLPVEAEEVFVGIPIYERGRRGLDLAWGKSASGRYLLVVFLRKKGKTIRVITARDMKDREKKSFRRRSRP